MKLYKYILKYIRNRIAKLIEPEDVLTDFKRNYSKYSKGYRNY